LAAYANQDVPFERLVELLNPQRSLAYHPLFQVMLAFNNVGSVIDSGDVAELSGLTAEGLSPQTGAARFDLTFVLRESHEPDGIRLNGEVEYAIDLFDEATVRAMIERLVRLLTGAAANPDRPIGAVDLLDDAERQLVLDEWSHGVPAPEPATLPALFEAQVARTPDAVAVVSDGTTVSYADLNRRANHMAHHLIRRGVGTGRTVGVALNRSEHSIVIFLAIAKAGGIYLPLDPEHPVERIALMCRDTAPALLVTELCHFDALAAAVPDVPMLLLDDPETLDAVAGSPDTDPVDADRTEPLLVSSPAYIIYTSGSTGTPKGVVVEHRGIAALAAGHIAALDLGPDTRVFQAVAPTFDVAVADVVMALLSGAAVAPGPAGWGGDGDELAAAITAARATHVMMPASLLATVPEEAAPTLRYVVTGGEICPPEVVRRWSRGRRLINAYGPTETTVCATLSEPLEPGSPPAIGRPVPGVRVFVLDAGLSPVPVGVAGELYVSGSQVARGYVGRAG
ncbi:AMP-binding protein, partial [Micromonospora sp. NPDC051296]|uniref:non-ribosomal peptide synthetase n=1 Tax=Micromonospora sp. NPDC051296 TaxID=3155046 RepID=UPI00343C7A3F